MQQKMLYVLNSLHYYFMIIKEIMHTD